MIFINYPSENLYRFLNSYVIDYQAFQAWFKTMRYCNKDTYLYWHKTSKKTRRCKKSRKIASKSILNFLPPGNWYVCFLVCVLCLFLNKILLYSFFIWDFVWSKVHYVILLQLFDEIQFLIIPFHKNKIKMESQSWGITYSII